jgi:hypothetical protein
MTASPTPTPTFAVPGDVGLPSEETIARALNLAARAMQRQFDAGGSEEEIEAAIWQYLGPAFEAKERELARERDKLATMTLDRDERWKRQRELAALLDKQMGTPCEQIRHQQEIDALEAELAQAVEALEPFAKMADEVSDKTGVPDKQISDDTFMFVRLGSCRRARSASARGETPALASGKERP